jgi:hypothetical protein
MSNAPKDLPAKVAAIIERAWPCFIHYADPRELVGDTGYQDLERLLDGLYGLKPTIERPLPDTVPADSAIAEAMVMGHEHNPACIALALALARCIPALTQTVGEGRCPTFDGEDQWAVRVALADIHHLHHRLDPTHEDDTPLIEALCTKPATALPVEIGTDWRYMVRLTHEAMGGTVMALDDMPMRCFIDLAHARNWSVMQALWDCEILCEGRAMLGDPRHLALVSELEQYDGSSDRVWRMPSTQTALHLTPRPTGA